MSDRIVEIIDQKVKAETAQNLINNAVGYNLQWMDSILKYMEVSKDNKLAVGEKVVSYLHIIEAEMRRYYDL